MSVNLNTATKLLPGGDYNIIPYVSTSFPQSAPERLFGLAKLFGLAPPAIETARVLELGCASGGNIIPLASRYPKMRIVGVDLTPRHVDEGRARLAALGLENIEIRQGDIATFDSGKEPFDAIICHGVYSWVPAAVREAILRIAGQRLSPNGIAYISYNVFPGWHLRGVIRDLMLFHAGTQQQGSPTDRVAKARWVIENLAGITNPGSPYGAKLREEAQALTGAADAYILGEFLAPYNEPCYFRDFHAAAERSGLSFLCEAEVEACLPETHGEQVAQLVRTMSANQLMPMEQYIDFFMGRQFRQSLLVRKEQEARLRRNIEPNHASGLPVHGRLQVAPALSTDGRSVYSSPNGRTIMTSSPCVRQALDLLVAAFPETRTVEQLVIELRQNGTYVGPSDETEILDSVFKMIIAGLVRPSVNSVRVGRSEARFPAASKLGRADTSAGRTTTTNLKHEPVNIDPVWQVLLPLLDGKNDRAALKQAMIEAANSKRINVTDNNTKSPLVGQALAAACAEHVELALKRLEEAAMLEPST